MRVIGLLRSPHASIWVAIAICGAASGLLRAQTTFATLQGTIHDSSGAVIANAAVAVKNAATGVSRSTLSNSAGIYSFPDLQPSTYELTVSAAGFANQRRANIGLTVDAEETLNIALSPSAINSEVDVTATPAGISSTMPKERPWLAPLSSRRLLPRRVKFNWLCGWSGKPSAKAAEAEHLPQ